eukprot:549370-Pelagomonas_calceolata.AAC.1
MGCSAPASLESNVKSSAYNIWGTQTSSLTVMPPHIFSNRVNVYILSEQGEEKEDTLAKHLA